MQPNSPPGYHVGYVATEYTKDIKQIGYRKIKHENSLTFIGKTLR